MKISLCTQIKNRLNQFVKTFEKNLEKIKKHIEIEWIIIDYKSSDSIDNFMLKYIEKYSFIKYYKAYNSKYSMPIAKNLCARLSSGNFIFNLDCDNFIDDIIDEIKILNSNQGIYCHEYRKGTHGRLGIHKDIFLKVGGYDENFYPAGRHDIDIILRCESIGYKFKNIPNKTPAIQNTKKDTILNFDSKELSWEKMNEYNGIIMNYNKKKKIINPNNNIFTPCNLVLNFKDIVEKDHEF